MIYVTSYWDLETDFHLLQPDRLISILGPADRLAWPELAEPDHRLRIECDDVQYPASEYVVPTLNHIGPLIDFLGEWNGQGDVMIHCKAGTSRSPAAALIAFAMLNPGREQDGASLLRRVGPQTRPSQVFLRLADKILDTGNALENAALAMPMSDRVAETDLIALPHSIGSGA